MRTASPTTKALPGSLDTVLPHTTKAPLVSPATALLRITKAPQASLDMAHRPTMKDPLVSQDMVHLPSSVDVDAAALLALVPLADLVVLGLLHSDSLAHTADRRSHQSSTLVSTDSTATTAVAVATCAFQMTKKAMVDATVDVAAAMVAAVMPPTSRCAFSRM